MLVTSMRIIVLVMYFVVMWIVNTTELTTYMYRQLSVKYCTLLIKGMFNVLD